ncbi:MAG TPA: TMEM175 family protein [Flavobacteriales bacterium]|nr:TMEM175 family protein [Flavobacteriales bacterium]
MKTRHVRPGTERLLAFSDGVIAIIITLMILEVHLPELPEGARGVAVWQAFGAMLPKLLAYVLSFVLLAVFWVNHHTLFASVKHSSHPLLWHNCHVLFWASMVPLATAFLGDHPTLPEATAIYGGVQLMILVASNAMVYHLIRHKLLREDLSPKVQRYYIHLNTATVVLTALATLIGYWSTTVAIVLFAAVAGLYFLPRPIEVQIAEDGVAEQ